MKQLSKIFLIFLFLSSNLSFASDTSNSEKIKARFQAALTAYDNHKYVYPDPEITIIAKELFDAGTEYYAKDDANLGVLAYYYAKALNHDRLTLESIPYLEQSIKIYKGSDDPTLPLLLDSTIELAKVKYKLIKKKSQSSYLFTEALKLAKATNDEIQLAKTQLEIGKTYLSYKFLNKRTVKKARNYVESAFNIFQKNDLSKQIEAAFWAGKANRLLKQREAAAKFFEITINKASDNSSEQQYSEVSHAFLVDVYSKLGEENKATEHCQAIGRNQVWDDSAEPKPLYILQPKYPTSAAKSRTGGIVTLKFTIDTNGFTKNIMVAKSKGGKRFEKVSIQAIKKWRFAPKFEKGQPVEADVKYTMQYKIGS